MRYWVYINDKVEGPFEEDKLVTLEGFTPDTLLCSETTEAGANQEWVKASTVFEFDPLESTITRALPTPEELNTAVTPAGTTDPNLTQALKEAHFASQAPAPQETAPSSDATRLILEKLDSLTREIEGLKQKMEEVITAASAQQHVVSYGEEQKTASLSAIPAPELDVANTITLTNRDMSTHTETPMDDSSATTESLVSQAESLVAQANQPENKGEDFLHGIDLASDTTPSEPPAELPLGGKGEEEVVLRSALDSLYGVKIQEEQTEKEKESTFQDLLNPNKGKSSTQEPAAKPTLEDALKAVETSEAEKQKEEVLQQFAPSEHKDFIAEALAEAEKENQAKQAEVKAEAPAKEEPVKEATTPALEGLTPVTPQQEAAIKTDLPNPENEVPVLSIAPEEAPAKEEPVKEEAPAMSELPQIPETAAPQQADTRDMGEEVPLKTVSAMLPGLASLGGDEPQPQQAQPAAAAPVVEQETHDTETIQELVPGAKLDKESSEVVSTKTDTKEVNLISAEDLKNATAETAEAAEPAFFDAPAASTPAPQPQAEAPAQTPEALPTLEPAAEEQQTPAAQEPAPATVEEQLTEVPAAAELEKTTTQAEYTPNDLTEIELKEGSTYLISDFVPPAQASDFAAAAQDAMARSQDALKNAAKDAQKADELAVEEVVPVNKQQEAAAQAAPAPEMPVPGAEVTVSQIILENTIKTKRGAALDIKTVPMVKDPADSQRLDLSDTELQDVTMQHDVKSADLTPAPKKAKTMVMAVMMVILLGAIYAGVAYLQLIPDNMNFINPKPAVSAEEQQAQMEEMLPSQAPAQPAAPQVSPADRALTEVKNYALPNGMTLEQLIASRHPNAGNMIEWSISTAVDPDNYSVMAKVPPENPQSFKISYRFNYNTVTKALEPTISDSKNLLMSVGVGAQAPAANMQQPMTAQQQQALQQQRMMQQQQQQAMMQQQRLAQQQAQQRAMMQQQQAAQMQQRPAR